MYLNHERTQELSHALDGLKEAERQLIETKTQAALTRVVAGILHEVNSPLGTMRSSVDSIDQVLERCRTALAQGSSAGESRATSALNAIERGKDLAQVARASAQRLGSVMDSLQRFVSLDEADIKLLDVKRGIDDVQTLLQPSLGDRIQLLTTYADEPAFVRGNPSKLNRVFLNLLQNAINSIPERGEVRVAVGRHGGEVVLDVSDDGAGIPTDRLADLFDVGFTTKNDGRVGLRLGLPSSKRWVEEAGGTLQIDSTEGEGTRVRVTLPAADARA